MILSAQQDKALRIMTKNYLNEEPITVISGYAGT